MTKNIKHLAVIALISAAVSTSAFAQAVSSPPAPTAPQAAVPNNATAPGQPGSGEDLVAFKKYQSLMTAMIDKDIADLGKKRACVLEAKDLNGLKGCNTPFTPTPPSAILQDAKRFLSTQDIQGLPISNPR